MYDIFPNGGSILYGVRIDSKYSSKSEAWPCNSYSVTLATGRAGNVVACRYEYNLIIIGISLSE